MSIPAIVDPAELLEELIEAQLDTIEMVGELAADEEWASHLAYLQRLHREAMAALAIATDPLT